jgi:hypothetical protein
MAYTDTLGQYTLREAFRSFLVRFADALLMIVIIAVIGFYGSFMVLGAVFLIGILYYLIFAKKQGKVIKWINKRLLLYQRAYNKGYLTLVLSTLATFLVILISSYFVVFSKEFSLLFGFLIVGFGNNLTEFFLTFVKRQYVVYGTTIEYFLLSTVLNVFFLMLLGMHWIIALYLALAVALFHVLPWVDHHISPLLVTAIFYVLLFI